MADILFPDAPDFNPGSQRWRRKVEALLQDAASRHDLLEQNVDNNAQAASGRIAAVANQVSDQASELTSAGDPGLPPEHVYADPYSYFNSIGNPRAGVKLSWDYIEDTDDDPVDPVEPTDPDNPDIPLEEDAPVEAFTDTGASAASYEVWLRAVRPGDPDPEDDDVAIPPAPEDDSRRVTATPTMAADVGELELGKDYAAKIRPVASDGTAGDFSDEVLFSTPADIELILDPPDDPTLTTGQSNAYIAFDGLLGGSPPPSYFTDVLVQRHKTEDDTWPIVGSIVRRGAWPDVGLPVGSTQEYRLVARDTLGRLSAPSASASIVIEGVKVPDFDEAVQDLIANAGGNNITPSTSPPPSPDDGTGRTPGDIWQQWSSLDATGTLQATWRWNGSGWVQTTLVVDGSIVARHLNVDEIWANSAFVNAATVNVLTAGSIHTSMIAGDVGAGLVLDGNPSITLIQGDVNAIQNVVQVTDDGTVFSKTGSQYRVIVANDRIAMQAGNTDLLTMKDGKVTADYVDVNGARIGNHKIDPNSTPGHTTWRPI